MRIVAALVAREVGRNDHGAVAGGGGREELVHPRVVVGAVVEDDLRVGDGAGGGGASLEQMRVVVRVVEDAGHGHMAAADLGGEVAIEVFGCDDADRVGSDGQG